MKKSANLMFTILSIFLCSTVYSALEAKDKITEKRDKYFKINSSVGTVPIEFVNRLRKIGAVQTTENIITKFKKFKQKPKNKNKILKIDAQSFAITINKNMITPKITCTKRLIKIEWKIYPSYYEELKSRNSGLSNIHKYGEQCFYAYKIHIHK